MHPLIERYGKEAVQDLLDMVFILNTRDYGKWREFALRHQIIKKTTKTIYPRVYESKKTYRYVWNSEGKMERVDYDEPVMEYTVVLRNGRNQEVFRAYFKEDELQTIMEQINQN